MDCAAYACNCLPVTSGESEMSGAANNAAAKHKPSLRPAERGDESPVWTFSDKAIIGPLPKGYDALMVGRGKRVKALMDELGVRGDKGRFNELLKCYPKIGIGAESVRKILDGRPHELSGRVHEWFAEVATSIEGKRRGEPVSTGHHKIRKRQFLTWIISGVSALPSLASDPTLHWEEFQSLRGVKNADQVLERLTHCHWRHDIVYAIRSMSGDLSNITAHIAEAGIEAFKTGDLRAGGLASNILGVCSDAWQPRRLVLDEMQRLVEQQIEHGTFDASHPMQLMASVLARRRREDPARRYLRQLILVPELRGREWCNTSTYYGTVATRYGAYYRHLQERQPRSSFLCWDLPSLLEDLNKAPRSFANAVTVPLLLHRFLPALQEVDGNLSREVNGYVEQWRQSVEDARD